MSIRAGEFHYPSTESVVYGKPAGDAVAERMTHTRKQRAYVITGRSVSAQSQGPLQQIVEKLGARCVGVYAAISAHTPREDALKAAAAARVADADVLVGVGGGSVIDAVKAVQLCLWLNLREIEDFERYSGTSADPQPIEAPVDAIRAISVSTTLSAAEFTSMAGITHSATRTKQIYKHPLMAPALVILDPAALKDTPPALLYATAVRSIDHAVETYLSPQASPATEGLSLQGLRLLAGALWRMPDRPGDLALAMQAQFGMWQAIAAAGVPTGASHGIGYALGAGFGVSHGETSCVMLPAVVEWTSRTDVFGAEALAEALERPGKPVCESLRQLIVHLNLPVTLQTLGVGRAAFPELAARALAYPSLRASRRPVTTIEQVLEILELAS